MTAHAVLIDPPYLFRPLHPVVVAWFVALVAILPRRADAWAIAAFGLVLRLVLSAPAGLLPMHKGLDLAVRTRGVEGVAPLAQDVYGDGWPALLTLLARATGMPADIGHVASLAAGVLAVVLLVDVVDRAVGERAPHAGRLAGLVLACLPAPIALAQSVGVFPVALGVEVAMVAGLARRDRVGAWAASLSAGLLAHLRPLLLGVACVGVVALWRRGARGPAAVAGALVGVRTVSLALILQGGLPAAASAGSWWEAGPWAVLRWAALDPSVVPWAVTALAVWGAASSASRDRWLWGAVLAATSLPYLHFDLPFDRLRMQLPAHAWLAAFAGVGLSRVRGSWPGLAVVAALAASVWTARAPRGAPAWVWVGEEAVLRAGLADCAPGAVVAVADGARHGPLRDWLAVRGHPRTVSSAVPAASLPADACRFVSVPEHLDGDPVLTGWEPFRTATLPPSSGGGYPPRDAPYVVGWYRPARPSPEGA